jgi:hypothetical protein
MTPEQHIDQVRELAELKGKVSDMAQDVTKIVKQMDMVWELQRDQARIQEQILDGRESVRRAFERIERNEEASGTMKENTEKWINRGIGAWFVGALLLVVIQALILDRVNGYQATQEAHTQTLVSIDRRISWAEYEMKQALKKREGAANEVR